MGDSITAGSEITGPSYPELLSERIGVEVHNEGVGGATSTRGAAAVDGVIAAYQPDYVLIMYGVNDMWRTDRSEIVIENLDYMVTRLQANGAVPIVATVPPNFKDDPYLVKLHEILNRRIRSYAQSAGLVLVDVGAAMEERRDLFLSDGFHPNDAGTALIADLFYDALVNLGVLDALRPADDEGMAPLTDQLLDALIDILTVEPEPQSP